MHQIYAITHGSVRRPTFEQYLEIFETMPRQENRASERGFSFGAHPWMASIHGEVSPQAPTRQ